MDSAFREFLNAPDPESKAPRPRRRCNLFGWSVFILLLTGSACASWIGSLYIFGHPEDPRCYSILKALKKIDAPRRFEVTSAPLGTFYTAKEIYESCLMLTDAQIATKNDSLLREYIGNYASTKRLVPYLAGHFKPIGARELKNQDVFGSGLVAVAESVDCPQVMIEHVYPGGKDDMPRLRLMLATTPDIKLERSFDLSAVVHIERMEDGRLMLTVVPLSYDNYAYRQGAHGGFRFEPPQELNLEMGFPIVRATEMAQAAKTLAFYQSNKKMLTAQARFRVLSLAPEGLKLATATAPPIPSVEPSATPVPVTLEEEMSPVAVATPVPAAAPYETALTAPSASPASTPAGTIAYEPSAHEPAPAVPAPPQPASAPATVENITQVASPASAGFQQTAHAPQIPNAVPQSALQAPQIANAAPQSALQATQPAVAQSEPPPLPATESTPLKNPLKTTPHSVVSTATTPAAKFLAHATPNPAPPSNAIHAPKPKTAIASATNPSPAQLKFLQAMAAASTPAKAQPVAKAQSTPLPWPPQIVLESNTPYGRVSVTQPSSPSGVKLEPFLSTDHPQAQQPARSPQTALNRWPTYAPGKMPQGRMLDTYQVAQLLDAGTGGERYYLRGRFKVTAAEPGRAVLRQEGYEGVTMPSTRIIVDFPEGSHPLVEGTPIARGNWRPFQIVDVRRGNNGVINVYAREITQPWTPAEKSRAGIDPQRQYQAQRFVSLY
jgi:hypothetical protein